MNDLVSQAISRKSRDFQSQLAASQVAASLLRPNCRNKRPYIQERDGILRTKYY